MFAAAAYFQHSGIFCVFAILAAILAIALSHALAYTMGTFFIICHMNTCFPDLMLEPVGGMVKSMTL
jgi:hypothetical protein